MIYKELFLKRSTALTSPRGLSVLTNIRRDSQKLISSSLLLLVLCIIPAASAYTQGVATNEGPMELKTSRTWEVIVHYPKEPCPANPDSRYNRQSVLTHFADILNSFSSDLRKYESLKDGFQVENGRPQEFFVRDLTDPSNQDTPSRGCINFLDGHIYHFAARYFPYSLSHIAFLENGKVKIFRAVNCRNSKQSIDDAIRYATDRLKINTDSDVIQRLRDYRRYGEYHTVDDLKVRCELANANEK